MYQATIKLFRVCMMMAAFGLFFTAAPVFATHLHDPDEGHDDPPATTEVDCSSGYYKRHTSAWIPLCCDETLGSGSTIDSSECDDILDLLISRGPGGEALRQEGKDDLDACFADLGFSPCDDGTAGGGGH